MLRYALPFALVLAACSATAEAPSEVDITESFARIETAIPSANLPISKDAIVEDLGGEFGWSEGPVWVNRDGGYLLFTDVPGGTIWKYSDAAGLESWMSPSRFTEDADPTASGGANGLFAYGPDRILVPDHGSRVLYAIDLATKTKTAVATKFEGKRLNSPNDVVVHSSGTLFFTDPPYGLKDRENGGDLGFNAVFALAADGTMAVVDDTMKRPNGVALSPDGRTLYVAEADPENAHLYAYDVSTDGAVTNKRVFLDVVEERKAADYGNMDGMAVATDGTIFATGPGGMLVVSPEGEILQRFVSPKPCANVTFGGKDRSTLYVTCADRLVRVQSNRTGLAGGVVR